MTSSIAKFSDYEETKNTFRKNMHDYCGKYRYGLTKKDWLIDIDFYADNFVAIGKEYFIDLIEYLNTVVQEVSNFNNKEYLKTVVFKKDYNLMINRFGNFYRNKFISALMNNITLIRNIPHHKTILHLNKHRRDIVYSKSCLKYSIYFGITDHIPKLIIDRINCYLDAFSRLLLLFPEEEEQNDDKDMVEDNVEKNIEEWIEEQEKWIEEQEIKRTFK